MQTKINFEIISLHTRSTHFFKRIIIFFFNQIMLLFNLKQLFFEKVCVPKDIILEFIIVCVTEKNNWLERDTTLP